MSCIGVQVKCVSGGSEARCTYPIYIFIAGLSDIETPSDNFIVVPMNELDINRRIDPRNKELGYVYFMKDDIKQHQFSIGSTIP